MHYRIGKIDMDLRELVYAVLEKAGALHVDFNVLNDDLRSKAVADVVYAAAFIAANNNAIDNIKSLNLTNDPEDLVEYLQDFADRRFVDEDAEEAGLARSFYHDLQMMLAGLEIQTGLPLTSPDAFSQAYKTYWHTTKSIILAVQFHRQSRITEDTDDGEF